MSSLFQNPILKPEATEPFAIANSQLNFADFEIISFVAESISNNDVKGV